MAANFSTVMNSVNSKCEREQYTNDISYRSESDSAIPWSVFAFEFVGTVGGVLRVANFQLFHS